MSAVQMTAEDLPTVRAWCLARGKNDFPPGWLPRIGYWVPGVLSGFLYRTDSGVCFLESLVANPETTREERTEAMHAVSAAVASHARELGYQYLLGSSTIPTVTQAARDAGYVVQEGSYAHFNLTLKKDADV